MQLSIPSGMSRRHFLTHLAGASAMAVPALSLTNSKIKQRAGFGPLLPMVYHAPFPRIRSWKEGTGGDGSAELDVRRYWTDRSGGSEWPDRRDGRDGTSRRDWTGRHDWTGGHDRCNRRDWTDWTEWTEWTEPPNLRRMLVDMIEEYARPTGHADLIRESIDGRVGEGQPPQGSDE